MLHSQASARKAGLRYVQDCQPGLSRQRWGRGFSYFNEKGDRITDSKVRARLKELKIPPAWTDVWICPHANGHLMATGRDPKGRKQYLYHPNWQKVRTYAKFDRMIAFGRQLSQLRPQVKRDMAQKQLSRKKVIATVVLLLERTLIRVGNEAYVRQNKSFGLTTLRNRHLSVAGDRIQFQFSGKSGIDHDIILENARLAQILKCCQALPGQELFQYRDADGDLQSVDSGDVNEYLQNVMGDRFSAKDFRTWFGSVRALESLIEQDSEAPLDTVDVEKQDDECDTRIRQAICDTAEHLGNRPATCKQYYIHPYIFEAYRNGELSVDIKTKNSKTLALPTIEKLLFKILDTDAVEYQSA